jgi:hypothetical protein
MRKTVEVNHHFWIAAPVSTVSAQFADLEHHIEANVHPNLRFEVLEHDPRHARFRQEVRLLGMRQRDLFERVIDADGSIHDVSVDGFNKGGRIDLAFAPEEQGGRPGTAVDLTVTLPTPPLMGWAAPLLRKQVLREVLAAAEQDKRDIESGYLPQVH